MRDIKSDETLRVVREKIHVEGNVYYDRVVLKSQTAEYHSEANKILGENEIKKKFNKARLRYKLSFINYLK